MDRPDQPHRADPRADRADFAEPVRDQAHWRRGSLSLFRAVQLDLAWALGPPDGRYLVREAALVPANAPEPGEPSHVIVVRTLDRPPPASWSRRLPGRRKAEGGAWLTELTLIDTRQAMSSGDAGSWLASAGEVELREAMTVLNRAVRAYRLATSDELLGPLDQRQALATRIGYGTGEELADGRMSAARELPWEPVERPLRRMVAPEGRLAALLTGQERGLTAEELILRARLDLDLSFSRLAALQMLIALDAAIAGLAAPAAGDQPAEDLDALRRDREPVADAAQAALAGELSETQLAAVTSALERVEGALRSSTRGRSSARG